MLTHIVLLQPRPDTSLDQIQTVLEQVKELQQIIPGVLDVQVGKNQSEQQQGYSYGMIIRFENNDQLQTYLTHPAHQAVAKEIMRVCSNLIEFNLAQ